jgi:periplasmic divalent cation tolerance protein
MSPHILCLVTIDDRSKAAEIAGSLVREKLVACVNILPEMRSIYSWKNEICDEPECLMIMKTKRGLFPRLQEAVKELHPYEVPEIISISIDQGLPDYLNWIDERTRPE